MLLKENAHALETHLHVDDADGGTAGTGRSGLQLDETEPSRDEPSRTATGWFYNSILTLAV